MKEVTVRKGELVAKLRENLANHKEDFQEAHDAWKLEAIEFHGKRVYDIEHGVIGTPPKEKLEPSEPASYEKNYLQALQMLEMEVGSEVTLGQIEFRQFVQDEWDFSAHFRNQVQGYTGKMRSNF